MTDWQIVVAIAVGAPIIAAAVVWLATGDYRTAVAWWRAQWYRLRDHEPADPYPPEAAEAPDPVDAHAATVPLDEQDTVPILRQTTADERARWRASEAWMAYAVADFDWHAAEYMATRKAVR